MNLNKIIIIVFASLSLTPNCLADQLNPLTDKYESDTKWANDYSELAYISMRCGAIYTTLSAYFLANGTKKEEKDLALLLDRYSEKLFTKSIEISIFKINMNQESIIKRMESLVKIYTTAAKENKLTNNNVFEGLILKDFEFCNKNGDFIMKLN